jgi:hypothetical protein
MSDNFKGVEPMILKSKINVPYHWWAGDTASKFLVALRDEKVIMGTKCAKCKKVYIPPRKACPVCFGAETEWVKLSDEGTVVSFTVTRRQLAALPRKVPVIFALIRLDGADTALLHYLDGVSPEEVKIGMRVKARFAGERKARMQDIECFAPVK